ncbi:DUF3888 domain-containing protein [Solibacillus sp. MA9]|uniref:DUF3888 domain-containing protein n=1 Tax=Solibacillus palustris TaxID=2908203 RepID=A0ABS9UCM9_9BACL|nr:DUF3888 domain-containing protein [Solibacillus sp. MA9]MCH7322098.1 DUF3888 domain-containing protein [Solibacillus sp. MA9]
MKRMLIVFILSLVLITPIQTTIVSSVGPTQDSEELRLQDMLMLMLTPYIEKDLTNYYYPKIFKDVSPHVTPWKIELIETKRNHFRGFDLQITFEIEPTDGGHNISLGKDRMTYEISSRPEVKLINHTHLKTYKYPPEL